MRKSVLFILILVLLVIYASLFVVQEGQRGIVMKVPQIPNI